MIKHYIFLFILSLLGVFALQGAENASAMSPPTTSTLSLISPNGNINYDVSDNGDNPWINHILTATNAGYGCDSTRKGQLVNLYQNNNRTAMTVTQIDGMVFGNGSNFGRLYVAVWWSDNQQTLYDSGDSSYSNIRVQGAWNDVYVGILSIDNSGNYQFNCRQTGGSGMPDPIATGSSAVAYADQTQTAGYIYYSTFQITDLDVPSEPPAGIDYVDYAPDFYSSVSVDWKASIHDQNFNTFDANPFLCEGGLAPVLNYEIFNITGATNVLLTSGTQSATAQIDYQFDKTTTSTNYRVLGWYDCGVDSALHFSETGSLDFTINGSGSLAGMGLDTCLQEDFPFFNQDACINGIQTTLALLTFQNASATNNGLYSAANANPNNCHQLGTLGTWIHQQNTNVCPAFSSSIRTIITPFITFILGALVFYYISRGRGVIIE